MLCCPFSELIQDSRREGSGVAFLFRCICVAMMHERVLSLSSSRCWILLKIAVPATSMKT